MTAKATRKPPTQRTGGEDDMKLYTPEEVAEKGFLPYQASTLRKKCQRYEIHHTRKGTAQGAIYFTREQIEKNRELLLTAMEPIAA